MHAILPNGFPKPTDNRIAIRVTPNAERSIREGHPWLFEHSIRRQSAEGQPGDLGVLFDRKERFLAVGLYDPNSPIRVRILQHGKSVRIDAGWFRKQIAAALQVRNLLDGTQTTGYRLVHGENDGLPGLVIDRYADTLCIKLYSSAWFVHLFAIIESLAILLPVKRMVLRLSRSVQPPVDYPALDNGTLIYGLEPSEPVIFQENGLTFEAYPKIGQKTGFFLDQRENRKQVGEQTQ
ncbi:class I SAM-dependent rRNA methyltransferase [Chloroflexi bacterium TSY]|nr:class I SAM-dependent rRNA methyltransferase [Chloroflexi bacterium TSY]